MPKGPNGQKRPGDVIGAAVMVAKIATGEIEEPSAKRDPVKKRAASKVGGQARARVLTAEQRSNIAKAAAKVRWRKAALARENAK